MFKKLKIKFIATIMVLLTSIVGIVFGIIFVSTKNNNENYLFSQIEQSMDFIMGVPGDNLMNGGKINNKGPDVNNNNQTTTHNIEGISILYQVINEAIVYNSTYDNINDKDIYKIINKVMSKINFQTDRMSKLINNLIYLAKADNNEQMGKITEFNLSDSILNQILSFEAVIYENNLQMDYNIEEGIIFNGDKEEINQLMGIFIDNAVKHSFENTCIKVEVLLRKQMVLLSVENTGETIPKEDLKKVFERFYRVDKSRERERGGYGLGLSIALSIVNKYKGNIKVESENNITKFSAKLPINVRKK